MTLVRTSDKFLSTKKNAEKQFDIILITGDAYIDHPSFGIALLGRLLEAEGYSVGIISQPDVAGDDDFLKLGKPRLFFGISSGNMDSMINKYTAQKKIRSSDAYTPEKKKYTRPDRALIKYSQKIRALFKDSCIVIGGIEASLRRIPHYDYWSDKIRNSVLLDSRADLLVYGMGERQILEIAEKKKNEEMLCSIPGTVEFVKDIPENAILLPEFDVCKTKAGFLKMTELFYRNHLHHEFYIAFAGRYLKHNTPAKPLTIKEMDRLYGLPFQYRPHPENKGKITAFEQIKDSLTVHRGCYGGCNFCAIGAHQGKHIQSRSMDSVMQEARNLINRSGFSGTITDAGGPTANMYGTGCTNSQECNRRSCLYPDVCQYLNTDHRSYVKLLKSLLRTGVHVRVSSGVRFDLGLKSYDFIKLLAAECTGGYLKLAPEHVAGRVLKYMYKPGISQYELFTELFTKFSLQAGKKQFVIPYLIVGHPGETLKDTVDLAVFLRKNRMKIEQVQEFTPTPMTVSTCMYFTGQDFETGRKINNPKGREIRLMKALVQWYKKGNKKYVIEALKKAGMLKTLDYLYGKS